MTRNEDKRSQKKEIEGKKYIMCNKCILCLIYYTCVMFIMYFCKNNYCNPIFTNKKMVIFKKIVKSENEVKRRREYHDDLNMLNFLLLIFFLFETFK